MLLFLAVNATFSDKSIPAQHPVVLHLHKIFTILKKLTLKFSISFIIICKKFLSG